MMYHDRFFAGSVLIIKFFKEVMPSFWAFVRGLPQYFFKHFVWWSLLVPMSVATLVYLLSDMNVFGWGDQVEHKNLMEILHPSLLALGVAVSLWGWLRSGDRALALMAGVCGSCLARELGGQGTSVYLIFGLLVCIWYANVYRQDVATFLHSRWPRSLVAICFISYAGSQLLDRGVVKRVGRLLNGDAQWLPSYSSNMEESLETLGGVFLVMSSVALYSVATRSIART